MSSEALHEENIAPFLWKDGLDPEAYVYATYYFETDLDPRSVAIAMASEQSATAATHADAPGYDIETYAARVVSVERLGETQDPLLPTYWLNTSGYRRPSVGSREDGYWQAITRIAFPLVNLTPSVTSLWNVVVGELPRLGFLNAVKLIDLDFPDRFLHHFSGPRYGITGLRAMLGIEERPLFCRSTRPAVGLTVDMMLEIGQKVLRGGFDILKDDELTYSPNPSAFKERVSRTVELIRRLEKETGQRKLYFANVIDDYSTSLDLVKVAEAAGANGVMVAPAIQGMGVIPEMARQSELAIMSHCTGEDIWIRLPRYGVRSSVMIKMQRLSGADMVMLPGNFSTADADPVENQACIAACTEPMGTIKPALPVMARGKRAEELPRYIKLVGGADFVLIVATAVDEHPAGLEAGARAFGEAWLEYKYGNQS